MTDLETKKPAAQETDSTAALTASEGNQADTPAATESALASQSTEAVSTDTANTEAIAAVAHSESSPDALLAAIEAIVPSADDNTAHDTTDTVAADSAPTTSDAPATESAPAAPELAISTVETTSDTQGETAAADSEPQASADAATAEAAAAEAEPADTESAEAIAASDETAPVAEAEAAPVAEEKPRIPFADLNLDPRLQKGIDEQGFSHCTPIQSEALPFTLAKRDVIGKAQTGTGKTAAFLITIIQNLLTEPEQEERYNGEPRALILAPTRELALQIQKDAQPLLKHTGLNMVSIVGGMDYKKQQKHLQEEIVDIVVGTPGRLIDFVRGKDLFLSETEIVVIDEADRMLDMGFIPDVKRLVRETPYKTYRQTLLFSATFTADIMNLSENWTTDPVRVEIEPTSVANASVDQKIYIVTAEQKLNVLYNLITQQNLDRVMVFVNRRDETRDLTTKLKALGVRVAMLSGEIPQHKRLRTLENFRNGRLRVMVATDVAGRGIHIEGISHVVNYTLPEDPEDYVHRIGRTGRAGATGTSVSFACEEDAFLIPAIETLLGEKVLCTHPEPELLAELPELIAE